MDGGKKLAIPDEAVLDSGIRKIVFIDKGEGRYAPVEVKLGGKFDNYYEILSGLSPGERIIAVIRTDPHGVAEPPGARNKFREGESGLAPKTGVADGE